MFCARTYDHWSDVHSVDNQEFDHIKWHSGNEYVSLKGDSFILELSAQKGSEFMRNRDLKIFKVVDKRPTQAYYIVKSEGQDGYTFLNFRRDGFRDDNDDLYTLMDV